MQNCHWDAEGRIVNVLGLQTLWFSTCSQNKIIIKNTFLSVESILLFPFSTTGFVNDNENVCFTNININPLNLTTSVSSPVPQYRMNLNEIKHRDCWLNYIYIYIHLVFFFKGTKRDTSANYRWRPNKQSSPTHFSLLGIYLIQCKMWK